MGRVYTDLGQEDKALALFNQALTVWRSLGIKQAIALTLNNMGRAFNNLGQREDALKVLNESLSIWHEIDNGNGDGGMMSSRDRLRNLGQLKDLKEQRDKMPAKWREEGGHAGEASTLDNLGRTYADMGQGMTALDYFNQALPLWRDAGEQGGESLTLNNMARTYADLGKKQKALETYNQALATWREVGNRQGEASTLNNIGRLYRDLGLQQSALDYYNQALPIWREVGNRSGEALALNDIGRAYADMHQGQKALEYSDQALPIWRETGNRRGEASTLNNMGRDYSSLGQADKALEFDIKALSIWREVEDRRGQAMALMTTGWAYSAQKEPVQALASLLAALSLTKAAGDPELEGGIETSLMVGFRNQHRLEEAIFFGMEAVNSYQQMRRNISGLDKDLQAGFAQSKSSTYRILAELLVQAGRLGEAEQILDLLKEQELNDIVRGAAPDAGARIEPLKLSAAQQKAQDDLATPEKMAVALTELCMEYETLQAKAPRTANEDARLKQLSASIEQGIKEILAFFSSTIDPELEQKTGFDKENGVPNGVSSAQSYLQNTLAKLGPRVMGIRLLLGEDHAYVLVVTASTRKKIELKATPAELRSKTLEVLETLGWKLPPPGRAGFQLCCGLWTTYCATYRWPLSMTAINICWSASATYSSLPRALAI
jgi:tetratricopeptide (TPR) repeat protein